VAGHYLVIGEGGVGIEEGARGGGGAVGGVVVDD